MKKIACFLTAVALSLSAGLISVQAQETEPSPMPIISSIVINGGEMVDSGAILNAEVQGDNLDSTILIRGGWSGSDEVSLSEINPDKTFGVFSLQLPVNDTSKAVSYALQYKIGEQDWTNSVDILLFAENAVSGFIIDKNSFTSVGGTAHIGIRISGTGPLEAFLFSLTDRNGQDVISPIEILAQANDEEIYLAEASLAVPANADSSVKTYYVTAQIKRYGNWNGRSNMATVSVGGKPSDNSGGSSGNDSPSTPTTPEKEEPTYAAEVISKTSPSTVAVDVQNILAFGNEAKKSEPIALAELKADDKKVLVHVIPKNLPSNVSSNQIQTVLNAVSSVNFSKTPAEAKQAIDKVTDDAGAETMYVNFAVPQHVEFGFPVQVTVPTSFAKDTNCFLYYWNDSSKTYEQVDDFTIDPNGNATFSIRHCSDYFIADKQLAGGLAAGESSSEAARDVVTTATVSETVLTTEVTETVANPKTGNAAPVTLAVVVLAAGGILLQKIRK